jgi:V/A-type H+/Na+-transporting ATPase subunit D
MAKIKNTKNELKRQKDALKRFARYLPTLTLKKQQLQLEIAKVTHSIQELDSQIKQTISSIDAWVDVFAEDVPIDEWIKIAALHTKTENIAGVDLPVFDTIDFSVKEYDLDTTPLWVDFGIEAVQRLITMRFRVLILSKKQRLLSDELRTTTQRVNLFEKIKIPEARENVRKINIVLGDIQTAAVVTGKIAKHKIEVKHAAA